MQQRNEGEVGGAGTEWMDGVDEKKYKIIQNSMMTPNRSGGDGDD